MKIFKTLAVFFVLLALTMGAVAEVEYEPFKAGEITITLPTGLAAQVKNCETAGEMEIVVQSDSEDMNWSSVVSGVDSNGEITFGLAWELPNGATGNRPTTATVRLSNPDDWSFTTIKEIPSGYADCYENLSARRPTTTCYAELNIANYNASTNTLAPVVYDKENCAYLMAVFFNEQNEAYLAKYATLRITHTNANASTVKLNYVPDDRIKTSIGAEVTDGSVVYTLENGHSIDEVITTIDAPNGAVSFVMNCDGQTTSGAAAAQTVSVSLVGAGKSDYFNSKATSIVWYDADGKVLLAERLDVHVSVGTPKAWPNYITDETVKKGDVSFKIGTSAANASAGFVKSELDEASGTVNVSLNGAAPGGDLTQYNLYTVFEAPKGAVSYAQHSFDDLHGFLGASMANYWYEAAEKNLRSAAKEPVVNGEYVHTQRLFDRADFAADQGLTVYYDFNSTNANVGSVTMVDWFDADGNRIARQWIARTFESLATVVTQPIITEPMSDEMPQLIAEVPVSDYSLQVTSYPQNSESGTQIHYELKLVDADGNHVEFSNLSGAGTIQLLIPYPQGATAEDFIFTVNHYNEAGTSVQESVDTASATLEALDEGLLMTVKSLSPFVLSWEAPDGAVSADDLPKTGDSSNLFLYALLCCVSLAGIMLLRRKSRA